MIELVEKMKVSWLDEYTMLIFDTIDSTNLEAKRIIQSGLSGKYVVIANEQKIGCGKNQSFWYSPKGNLYCSILFPHNHELKDLAQISLVAALAGRKAIESFMPSKVKVKWPNDLLLNGKKFCGILVESFSHFYVENVEQVNYVIIGMGLNLEKSPKYLSYLATSLKEEGIDYISRNEVLNRFMEQFQLYYALWIKKGFKSFREEWMHNAYNIGRRVHCNAGNCRIWGLFKEIDAEGRLVVELETGEVHKMSSAEVFFQ